MINLDSKKVKWIDIVSHFSQLFLFHSIKRVTYVITIKKNITFLGDWQYIRNFVMRIVALARKS